MKAEELVNNHFNKLNKIMSTNNFLNELDKLNSTSDQARFYLSMFREIVPQLHTISAGNIVGMESDAADNLVSTVERDYTDQMILESENQIQFLKDKISDLKSFKNNTKVEGVEETTHTFYPLWTLVDIFDKITNSSETHLSQQNKLEISNFIENNPQIDFRIKNVVSEITGSSISDESPIIGEGHEPTRNTDESGVESTTITPAGPGVGPETTTDQDSETDTGVRTEDQTHGKDTGATATEGTGIVPEPVNTDEVLPPTGGVPTGDTVLPDGETTITQPISGDLRPVADTENGDSSDEQPLENKRYSGDDRIERILRNNNYYNHLSCGRLIAEKEITEEQLKAFYIEFVGWQYLTTKDDYDLINLFEEKFGLIEKAKSEPEEKVIQGDSEESNV